MRLPAVAIAAAFAGGIALGLHPVIAGRGSSAAFLSTLFLAIVLLLAAAWILARYSFVAAGGTTSLLCWVLLGVAGSVIGQQPRPADHILSLLESLQVDLHTPLRWYGTLRDEPTSLPWGYGYEIALSGVEFNQTLHPTRGGLRLSSALAPEQPRLPELHAGDEVSVLTQAKRPQVFKDEGAFDRRAYLAQQNIDLVATLRSPELLERVATAKPTTATRLARVRRALRDEIDQLFAAKPESAAVLRAMLLGDRTFIDQQAAVDFQKTGVFHVLVVAGLHVGAIAVALFWLGRKLKLPRLWTMALTLALLFAYIAVVEQRPPVLRAALMATLVVVGTFFFRRLELLNSAALAALLLLIANPLAMRDSSFQLTFLAIGSIAGLAVPWMEHTVQPYARALRGWRDMNRDAAHEPQAAQFRIDVRSVAKWISAHLPQRLGTAAEYSLVGSLAILFRAWELLALTLVLQLGMLPMMAGDFHRISFAAPVVNLLAVPLTGVIVPLGFLTLVAGSVLPFLGKLLAIPLGWLLAALLHTVQWFAHPAQWSYRIPGPPVWLFASFLVIAALLVALLRWSDARRRRYVLAVCGVWSVAGIVIATFPFAPKRANGKLELSVLDVGQGDALFVVAPGGKTLLIDGGGAFGGFPGHEEHNGIDPGEEAVSSYLWSRGYKSIDTVALTHAHQDHLGGLTAVLQNFHVGTLWIGREVSSPALAALEALAKSRNITIVHELRGEHFAWGEVRGEFLWPEAALAESKSSPKNNDSLVVKLQYGITSLLLPGDAEKQSEQQMLAEQPSDALRSDILKIGHHGSKNSTTPEFLAAVQPRIALISAGEDNPYGHPSPELLERLTKVGARILRTDRDGAIHLLTDGKKY